MTNPMYMQNPYQNQMYDMNANYPQQKSSNSFGGVVAMGSVGALTGIGTHYFKNRKPINKSGCAKDEFVKKVYDKNIMKNFNDEQKKVIKEIENVRKGLDKVNSADKLKELLKNNKCILECKGLIPSNEIIIDSINDDNYKETKKTLKESFEKQHKVNMQTLKNEIERCWDKNNKKFIKPDNMTEELFDVITKTKNSFNWKKCLKAGGIGALIGSGIAIVAKIFLPNNV